MAVSLPGLSRGPRVFALIVAVIVLSPVSNQLQETPLFQGELILEKVTPYIHLLVKEADGVRTLFLNGMADSAMYLNDSAKLVFPYTRYFALGWAFKTNISRVLFIGGGGFSRPKKFLRDLPVERVDVVEVDPDVIDVAKRYFEVESYSKINIYNQDGRTYLAKTKKTYYLIILDTYTKTYVPFHLMTVEFFEPFQKAISGWCDGLHLISSLVGDIPDFSGQNTKPYLRYSHQHMSLEPVILDRVESRT